MSFRTITLEDLTEQQIANRKTVCKILETQSGIDADTISIEAHLKEDLDMDSLDIVEVAMEMEKTFQFSIADEKLENLTTVGDLINIIETRPIIKNEL